MENKHLTTIIGGFKYVFTRRELSEPVKALLSKCEEIVPGFFDFKGFKKGTMHLKFKDKKVWEMLNRRYAKIKGQVLPEKI